MEIAAEHGALGLVSFLAILFVTFRELSQVRRRLLDDRPDIANLATGFILAIATYLATGLFLHFSYVRYFWLMLALASATAYVARRIEGQDLARISAINMPPPTKIHPAIDCA